MRQSEPGAARRGGAGRRACGRRWPARAALPALLLLALAAALLPGGGARLGAQEPAPTSPASVPTPAAVATPGAVPEATASPTPAATPSPTPAATPAATPEPIVLIPETLPPLATFDTLTSESLALRISQLGERLAAAEANATPETAARLNVTQQRLRDRVDRLRDWQNRLQRVQAGLERLAAAGAALEAAAAEEERFRQSGLEAQPPYSFTTLFALLDRRDDLRREQEAATIALEAARADLADAQRQREAAERDWRSLNEQFRLAAEDPARRPALARDLEDATIAVERARSYVHARDLELRITTLQSDRIARSLELVAEETAFVVNDLRFTRIEVSDRLAELGDRRDNVRTLLENARRSVETNARILSDAQLARDQAISGPDAPLAQLRTEVAERRLEISQNNVAFFEDQLDRLDREERLWNRMYSVMAGHEISQWREWRRETEDLVRSLVRDRGVRSANQNNLRTRLLEREREGAEFKGSSEERELRGERLRLLNNQDAYMTRDLADLDALLRLANRFLDVLSIQDAKLSWRERLDRLRLGVARLWTLELFSAGDSPVTVAKLAIALLVMVTGVWFSRRIAALASRMLRSRFHVDQGAAVAFERLATYTAVVILFLTAFRLVNIPLTAFAFLGGAAALAFGFGSQNLLNNFMSGLILLAERPIAVGDLVEVDGILGTVEEIGGRSTSIRSVTGNIHYVPNSQLLEKRVVNWLRNPQLRQSVTVGVAYGSPTRTVHKLLKDILERHGSILRDPEPLVIFQEFGDSALQFEVVFWIRIGPQGVDGRVIRSDLRHMIARSFEEHGIAIAFPQRDVHLEAARPLEVRVTEMRHLAAPRVGPAWAPTILSTELPLTPPADASTIAAETSRPAPAPAPDAAPLPPLFAASPRPVPSAPNPAAAAPSPPAPAPAPPPPPAADLMMVRELPPDEPEPEEDSRSPYGN